ncbi:hypothetical protein Q5P01_010569 [Channa striata]|uniref:L1 transposable element RRM domain-containing protein n=1 Tax=Channa striata TaxID=64152 RepID=A0AA88ST94_CHASR|nr:hypothetical protein Q5P01_010569 [Channa striata]
MKGSLTVELEPEEAFYGLCSPLPATPCKSPNSKKMCTNKNESETFNAFEQRISKNSADINLLKEKMEGLGFKVNETKDNVQRVKKCREELQERINDNERYNRKWNLRLMNLPERENENVRKDILELMAQVAPEDQSNLGFLIDTVHGVGRPRDDKKPRPVIIQFNLLSFRNKIWKVSRTADIMKQRSLRLTEDLTRSEKDCRNKLWPLVEKARKEGKKTRWQGPVVFIEGVRFAA